MATLTSSSSSQPQSWSKLFGSQRRRTYRSSYGSYATYESSSPSLEKSFHSKRYSPATQNGPGYDVSQQRRYTGARRGASADRDLERHVRESESLFTRAYTTTGAHSAEYEESARLPKTRRRRFSLSLDRDVGEMVSQPPRKRFTDVIEKQRLRRKLEMEKQDIEERRLEKQRETSVRDIVARATEEEYAGFDYRTLLDGIPKRHRSSSVSYSESGFGSGSGSRRPQYDYRPSSRASSVARSYLDDATEEFTSLRPRRRRSASVSISRHDDITDVDRYERKSRALQQSEYDMSTVSDFQVARGKGDISSYVLDPNEPFNPDDIKVSVLPSGKKATTYTQSNQYGSQSNTKEANAEIEKVIQKTKIMQDSMHTLENFVRANRSLFPEDTCVYQQIRFFQLTKEQLEQIGEHPDAVLYGVKIRERLVVPHGTDVTDILSRYYGNKENIEIEYTDSRHIKQEVEQEMESEQAQSEKSIRKQVEADFEKWDAQRILGNEPLAVKQANWSREKHDKYNHLHPHVTDNYVKSLYVNAGLDYDSIYEISRSQRSNASMVSDLESVYTRSSVPSSAERKARQRKLDIAPQFTSALRPKRISEGSTVRFNCSVTALPMPDVTWLRGNSALNEGGRIHMSNNFGLLSLEISEVRREDAGVYTVRIKNKEGEAVCNATLEVEEIGKEEEKLDGPRKPWFILEAQNQWCEVGQRATFEAQATGKPIPSFKWLRDNCPLAADGRIKMYSDEQGNAKLVVSDLRHGDNGLYFCVAESKAGKAKCAATLKVVDKGQLGDRRRSGSRSRDVTPMRSRRSMSRDSTPLGRRFIGSRESTPTGLKEIDTKLTGTAPWFLQTLTDRLEVHEGDPIDLKVIVDGDPKPRVTWLKEPYRELMYSRRHRVVTAGDHHVMVIASSISTDAGRFIVIAENDLGRIQSSCWVNMLPPRVVEGEDYDIKRSFVEMPEYEYELHASKEKGKMAPRFVKKLPVSKEVREGDDIRVECKIDEADAGDVISSIDVTTKVVKEGAIKTLTLEKSGEITVSRDVFADRDRTPTGDEESAAVEKGVAKETVEKAEADATMVVAGVATEAGATMTVAGVAAAAAGESDTVVVQEQMQQSQTVVIEAVPLEVSQSEKDKQRTADVNAIKAVTAEGDAVVEENIEPCLADRPQKAPKPAAETERQEDDDLEEVDLGVKVVEATPEKLAREASPPAIEEETIKPTQKEGEQGSIEAKVSAVLASKPEGEAMTVAGIAPPDKSQSDAVGTATKVEAVIHDSEVQGKVSEEPSQIATDVSLKETVQSVAEKSEVASSESKQEVTGSKLEVTESKTSSEVTFVSSEKSTEISQKVKGTYTSKQKLQLLGSSSEERSDSPPAGSSVKIKTKTRNGDASMTISKSDENHVTVAAVTLDQGASPERGQMRRMSSKELFLVRPSTIQVEPVVMTVAGIAPVAQSGEEQQQISQSYEKEINVVVQSEVAESHLSSEVPSPNAGRKGESRAESVISEDPTESSWTEYTSEATLTESEIDADVDDVIAVKKVTKVTRVVEATQDGGEKIVSKVTEVTTNVTEGGQTKVTCERQEETAAIASSDEESSSDESSSDESSDSESDAESTGSTVEIGKGNAVSAAVDSLQEGGDKDTCSSKSSSSDEETEVEIEMNVELKIDEGKIKESKEESREKTDEVIAESEESGSSEDSDSDSDTSSEEE